MSANYSFRRKSAQNTHKLRTSKSCKTVKSFDLRL